MKPYENATTDDQGRFELEIENYGRPVALMAIDEEQEHGQFVSLETLKTGIALTIRLRPLITLRGEIFCRELDEALAWSNVYINVTTNTIRLAQDYSLPSTFEFKLPPGDYELNAYGGEEVRGTNLQVKLSPDKPLVDLGRVNLAATPIGLLWGKTAPDWHITEARGIGTNAKLSDFKGKWLLLDFWGYWCGPCIRAMPELMRFYTEHASDRKRFEVLAIHVRGSSLREMDERLKLTVRDLWNGRTLPFPILLDATDKSTTAFGIQHYPSQVLIDPDGRIVRDGDLELLKHILDSQSKPNLPVAASENGNLIAVASTNSTIEIFEPTTDKSVLTLPGGHGAVHCAAFVPDGRTLISGSADGTLRQWNLSTGQPLRSFTGHNGAVFAVSVSSDGKTLASAGFDTLRLWDIETGREKAAVSGGLFPCWSVAFSRDGRQVAAGGAGTVKVWNTPDGSEKCLLRDTQTELVHSVAFSSDGQSLAVGRGNSVVLWNLATAQRQAVLTGLASEVVYLRFAPDGKTVTALSRGKTLLSWSTLNYKQVSAPASTSQGAEQLAARLAEDPEALNAEAWQVVHEIGQPSPLYERAFSQAQVATAREPNKKAYLTTLGAAQYRLGAFGESIETLGRAESSAVGRGRLCALLGFSHGKNSAPFRGL